MFLFAFLLSFTLFILKSHAACNLCRHGGEISALNQTLDIPSYPFIDSCKTLNTFLPFLDQESRECILLQDIGTLCGCKPPDNPCTFCEGTAVVQNPQRKLPFLANLFDGIIPNCEITQAYLLGLPQTHDLCHVGRGLLTGFCGCPDAKYNESAPICSTCPEHEQFVHNDRPMHIPGLPFQTCGELDEAVVSVVKEGDPACDLVRKISPSICGCKGGPSQPCSLCKDGSSITLKNKTVAFARDMLFGIPPNCETVEKYVQGHEADSQVCQNAQLSIGTFCGCPARKNHCELCPTKDFSPELKDFDPQVIELDPSLPIRPTCEFLEATQYQLPPHGDACFLGKFIAFKCGCRGGKPPPYSGAHTERQGSVLMWIQRIASFFTLIGTTAIQIDVLGSKVRRRRMYARIVFLMSVFDAVTAIAFGLGTIPSPKHNLANGIDFGFRHTYGTKATCIAQGWFSVFGFTSILYNIVLSIYYKLTILNGWRESRFKKYQWWMYGLPIVFGLAMATAGIYVTDISFFGCFMASFRSNMKYIIPILYIPLAIGVLTIVITTSFIYCKVRDQDRRAQKWRFPLEGITARGSSDMEQPSMALSSSRHRRAGETLGRKIERKAFWQAAAYAISFVFTWGILAIGYLMSHYIGFSCYPFWIVFTICIPINGFNNSLIYFRPRITTWYGKCVRHRRRRDNEIKIRPFVNPPGRDEQHENEIDAVDGRTNEARQLNNFIARSQHSERRQSSIRFCSVEDEEIFLENIDPSLFVASESNLHLYKCNDFVRSSARLDSLPLPVPSNCATGTVLNSE